MRPVVPLIFVIVSLSFIHIVESMFPTINIDEEPFLEYHFHTYFDANDREQVTRAIELRNKIIANCVTKKIIAIPLHYQYDPEKPVMERKLFFFNWKEINLKVFYCFR